MKQILTKIYERKKELQARYDVMDNDLDLYRLKPYKLLDYDGKTSVKRVDNVTLNYPYTFAQRLISTIAGSELRLEIINPKLDDDKRDKLESFYKNCLTSIDKLLQLRHIGKLMSNLTHIAALRGIVGVQVVLWQDNGNVIFDVVPLDTRFCAYEYGKSGLLWYSHETERTRGAVIDEYNEDLGVSKVVVTEYWDKDIHVVFGNEVVLREEENTIGHPPGLIIPIGDSMVLRKPTDTSPVQYEGQSIYNATREVFENLNKIATIWMTTVAFGFRPPMQRIVPPGQEPSEIPEDIHHIYTGGATLVDAGHSKFELMPLKDVNASLPSLFGVFSSTRQHGTFPDVEWGELEHSLSAIALAKLTEGRNQVFQPILDALGSCYQFICSEIRDQALKFGFNVNIKKDLLKTQHDIEVSFHPVSPEENISRYSIAAAARGFLDSNSIRREILKIQNESSVEKNLDREFAEIAVPELRLYKVAKRLAETGDITDEIMSQIILKKLGMTLGEETQPAVKEKTQRPPPIVGTMEHSAEEARKLGVEMGVKELMPEEKE